MLSVIVLLVASVITLMAALLSVALNPSLGVLRRFRRLPPLRTYHRVLEAIESLSDPRYATAGKEHAGRTDYYNVLTRNDRGFKNLVGILKKYDYLSGQVDELRLTTIMPRDEWGATLPEESYKWLTAKTNGDEKFVIGDSTEPLRPIRKLREAAKRSVQETISTTIVCLMLVWFVLNTLMVLSTD